MSSNDHLPADNIENSSGIVFFGLIEQEIRTKIPDCLKLILLQCDIDSAVVFSKLDDNYINLIEHFVRSDLDKNIIPTNVKLEDYLGKYAKCQNKFRFSFGQIILLKLISDTCKRVLNIIESQPDEVIENLNQAQNIAESNLIDGSEALRDFECNENLVSTSTTFSLFNYIGSLMITVFNDAKRLTLSAWSWPSRHVATEKANQFKATGDPVCDPNLHYVTPSQHKEFLDCIVQSDRPNLANMLRNSLALSLRVDGSVDRAQKHNTYVMGHVVNKDTTISTVFIGFEIPKAGKSLGYFECMKSVVDKIVPWEECMALITSLVTDGEALNSGSQQGLWIRFINAVRNSNTCNQPVIAVWCVPHRFNLGWKDVCNDCAIITILIANATSLSSYFHKSAERTQKLITTSAQKQLPTPLHYVTYYEVRWTEYVFNLLTVTLRNWRAAMNYFKCEKEVGLQNRWLLYDRIHLLAFITDVLHQLKKFQKTFQSDTISLLTIDKEKQKLLNEIRNLINSPLNGGWEERFLKDVEVKSDGKYFHGHKLVENRGRSASNFVFDNVQRKHIIDKLVLHLNKRLDDDLKLREDLQPLLAITSTVSDQSIKLCYTAIASDLDEEVFYNEYTIAANLLKNYDFKNPHDTLQQLHKLVPNGLPTLKTALARVVPAKPHSADVERLISSYNKAKTPDRILTKVIEPFHFDILLFSSFIKLLQ